MKGCPFLQTGEAEQETIEVIQNLNVRYVPPQKVEDCIELKREKNRVAFKVGRFFRASCLKI
jgi:hypothetical protein